MLCGRVELQAEMGCLGGIEDSILWFLLRFNIRDGFSSLLEIVKKIISLSENRGMKCIINIHFFLCIYSKIRFFIKVH